MTNNIYSNIIDSFKFEELKDKSILVTGGTGLLGQNLIDFYLFLNNNYKMNIQIIATTRSILNVKDKYRNCNVKWLETDLLTPIDYVGEIDYIIHTASPTKSKFFVEKPVETIQAIVVGTQRLLDFAKEKKVKGFVYISSIEVYGTILDKNEVLTEDSVGNLKNYVIRSSYPESKRLAETMCLSYATEYNIPVKIARLCQVIGYDKNDTRIISYMFNQAFKKQPIVLKTTGESVKSYVDILDAVSAINYLCINGKTEIYNVCNHNLVFSIIELANKITKKYIHKDVIFEIENTNVYPETSYLVMDNSKLISLGWKPMVSFDNTLSRIYEEIIDNG